MATTKKREHKDGTVSYEIRVSLGRDIKGKQLLKYHTWTPPAGMTAKQTEKALAREAVLFEEKCRTGRVMDTQTKFSDFAERWLEANRDRFSPAYVNRNRVLLSRINAAIGHIPLGKLQPHHLQAFYANLSESGIKNTNARAVSATLDSTLGEKGLTRRKVAEMAGVSSATVTSACRGKAVSRESAAQIAKALHMEVSELFTVTEKPETLASGTVNHHHRIISAILGAAVKWQVIFDNPASRVVTPKVHKKEAAYLDEKEALEVARALAHAPIKWRTATMLLMYSGMRVGEACGLIWQDVDFVNGLLRIRKANQYIPGLGVFEKETKNEASHRVIRIPKNMTELLFEYKAWQDGEKEKMGDRWHDSGKLFTQADGKPMHPGSINSWTKKFREEHSLPEYTPHALRHTAATLLIMGGVPVKAVSARLGHANQTTTMSVYSHAIQTVDALASDVIGDILGGATEEKTPSQNLTKTSQPYQKPHEFAKVAQ